MFDPTVSGLGRKNSWIWLVAGPLSFFLAAAMGAIFASIGPRATLASIRGFWEITLLFVAAWLCIGASVFVWADWIGANFGLTLGEHLWQVLVVPLPMAVTAICFWTIQRDMRRSGVVTAEAPVLSPDGQTRSLLRRPMSAATKWIGALLAAGGSIVAVCVSAVLLLLWGCEPPSLSTLVHRFPGKRKDLEKIVAMSDQDSEMAVIDPTWLELRDSGNSQKDAVFPQDAAFGIPPARWEEYRRISGVTT